MPTPDDTGPVERKLDEKARARQISDGYTAAKLKVQQDENGISAEMLDSMVQTVAEGLHTGATDMRHLLYCAYRNARKIQQTYEKPK